LDLLKDHKGRRVDGQRTICEVHRRIADILVIRLRHQPQILTEVMPYLNEAATMAERLVLAMVERKLALPSWQNNNIVAAKRLREARNKLVEELNASGCRL